MVQVTSWYNRELLSPEQIAQLDGALQADLAAMAELDSGAEPEAGG